MSVIAEAVAVAAAKGATSLAVQASAPAWKSLIDRIKPMPRAIRKMPAWQDVKLDRKQVSQAQKYLGSRFYTGLVQVLTYLLFNEPKSSQASQVEEIRVAFDCEFKSKVKGGDEVSSVAADIWQATLISVRCYVEELQKSEFFPELQMGLGALITRREDGSAEQENRDRNSRKHSLNALTIVRQRATLAESASKGAEISRAITVIREAAREAYAFLYMPHSKDQYRVPIEDIYVSRNLERIRDSGYSYVRSRSAPAAHEESSASREEPFQAIPEESLEDQRYVVIGNPGAGKSTYVRHLMYFCSDNHENYEDSAPLIFELKNYPFDTLRAFPDLISERLRAVDHLDVETDIVEQILTIGSAVVIFDGLDEVIDLTQRRHVVRAIESFCKRYPLAQVIVTSREEGYVGAQLVSSMFSAYRVPDFTDSQVEEYAKRWFQLAAAPGEEPPPKLVNNFLRDSAHANDLRVNPLMLSLLCMLYKYEGYIPENRPRVYEECAELLFDRWDRVKHVPQVLSPEAKSKNLVQELAYFFFSNQARQGGVEEYIVARVLRDYLARNVVADQETAEVRAREFLDYCAGRAWLLTKVGVSERSERLFGFTHRTFLEYFVACYLVRHNTSSEDLVEVLRPLIKSGSSSVIPEIAILRHDELTADGADNCLSLLLFESKSLAVSARTEYLPFALSCLRFMRVAPHVLRKIYHAALRSYGSTRSAQLLDLMAYAKSDSQVILRQICEEIAKNNATPDDAALALRHACYALCIRIDTDWAKRLRIQLQDVLLRQVPDLKNGHPDVLLLLIDIGALTLEEFLRQAPAFYLIGVKVPNGARRTFVGGPFSVEMARSIASGTASDSLVKAMALLFLDPEVLIPMPKYVASHLYALVEDLEIGDITRFPPGGAKVFRRSLKALSLMTCLLSVELDTFELPSIVYALGSKGKARRIAEGLARARIASKEIDEDTADLISQAGFERAWLSFLVEWQQGRRSVIDH